MVAVITNAAPQAILTGIRDLSTRVVPAALEPLPTHLPHMFTFAERGPTMCELVSGDDINRIFGTKTLDMRGPYATHATPFIHAVNAAGNAIMLQRLKPANAGTPASLVFWLDLLETEVAQFERVSPDNKALKLDSNGNPIPLLDGDDNPITLPGATGRWFVTMLPRVNQSGTVITQAMIDAYNGGDTSVDIVPVSNQMGNLDPREGTRTDPTSGEPSTWYPMLEMEVFFFGNYGNLQGVTFYAATQETENPVDVQKANTLQSVIYRMKLKEKASALVSPKVVETISGSQEVEFTFIPGQIDKFSDKEMFFEDVFLGAYTDVDTVGFTPTYGPFGRVHVYTENFEEVSRLVQLAEHDADPDFSDDEALVNTINLLNGVDIDNNNYFAYRVLGESEGGLLLNEYATHYPMGGSDGDMSFESFDALVAHECENYGDLENKHLNWARYPQSVIYDSGFTVPTKVKMLTPIGRRKDIWVELSTQDASRPQNTAEEETSIATLLRTAARVYPESTLYGTAACRAVITSQSGKLLNHQWKKYTPLNYEMAQKSARYMGASNGAWNPTYSFDQEPGHILTQFRVSTVNNTYKPARARKNDWDIGMVWAQDYDRRSLFWPGQQTVYDDDTSVLNARFNMIICVEGQKVCLRVWAKYAGDSKLTKEQFLERSQREIERLMAPSRFDNRALVQAEVFYTEEDDLRGYSYSATLRLGLNNMRTVGVFTVESVRREDLLALIAA